MLLYLHIPFCESKCPYCAFHSYAHKKSRFKDYMYAIHQQLLHDLEHFEIQQHSITSLFIGGGTPSTIPAPLYAPFFETLSPFLSPQAECTTEANPHSATQPWLEGMFALGINRLSLGVQSIDPQKLSLLGRLHTPHDVYGALDAAVAVGFKNLSIDLMYGTALDTPKRFTQELQKIQALPITHLSAYALTLEPKTPFYTRPEVANPSDTLARSCVGAILDAGFRQYEISNFGTYPCVHNLGYWQQHPYLGIGSGAVGFVGEKRLYPHRALERYIQEPLWKHEELLTPEALHVERLFLGLRSCVGVEASCLPPSQSAKAALLHHEGKLLFSEGRYYNTDYFLSDEIALFMMD